ncbi:Family T1, proteasome alpha subunit, threonine peptidase [Trichomonas vaginalis G3]|uniref:Proteasome subunit alpha type n=2 Tax=Trichomonas vaginalis TaxID=5722 RepID=A2FCM7_TRIV3|nr:threonine-type endopeptidase protein [Trichomonas vaginalis G3]EAX97349.1 Family T1, proteasome alpha subunit, threonine peptidase [Trichomonas vaginalis G3]KAI5533141.1 threonine-type endopeptidase protein [Trichomonas vaginalis G3]|eukprot:XP_001310279.1 Family T1, proteasome alpha subunit, threonine peptidase [Trichomonas vaginalis G3]
MFNSGSEYDRNVNTFSPDGRLLQVEYAIEAVKLGSSAVAILCPEGVIFAVEKRLSSQLLIASSVEKVYAIDDHVGVVMAGLAADGRTMVEHMRVEAQNHRFSFDEPIGIKAVTQSVCDLALAFGEGRRKKGDGQMSRPFGTALLVAGIENGKCHLFHTDPSGTYTECRARAIGGGSEGAEALLRDLYKDGMTLHEAEDLALSTLRQVIQEKLNENNVEVACARVSTGKFEIYTSEQRQEIVARLPPPIIPE